LGASRDQDGRDPEDYSEATCADFVLAWQYTRRFMATRVEVSAFAGGVLNSNEITHQQNLVGRFLGEGKTVFAYANNHYQDHSPSTLERFFEIKRSGR
jgi:hypothetical protein